MSFDLDSFLDAQERVTRDLAAIRHSAPGYATEWCSRRGFRAAEKAARESVGLVEPVPVLVEDRDFLDLQEAA